MGSYLMADDKRGEAGVHGQLHTTQSSAQKTIQVHALLTVGQVCHFSTREKAKLLHRSASPNGTKQHV